MKTVYTCLCAMLLVASPTKAIEFSGGTDADYAEIQAIADNWFDAYRRGDADAVADIYDGNARVMSEGDASYMGSSILRERLRGAFERSTTVFESDIEEIAVNGSWAFIVGTYAATNAPKDGGDSSTYGGRFFILLHQTADGWKVWRDIDNSTPDVDALIARMRGEN